MSLYESFDFLKELSGLQKLHLPLKDYMDFFLRSRRKCTGKKPRRNLVKENSSKVRRNASPEERWKNYAKRRHSQSFT